MTCLRARRNSHPRQIVLLAVRRSRDQSGSPNRQLCVCFIQVVSSDKSMSRLLKSEAAIDICRIVLGGESCRQHTDETIVETDGEG